MVLPIDFGILPIKIEAKQEQNDYILLLATARVGMQAAPKGQHSRRFAAAFLADTHLVGYVFKKRDGLSPPSATLKTRSSRLRRCFIIAISRCLTP